MVRAIEDMPMPTLQELDAAHSIFIENEPRDLFYRVATDLVDLAIKGQANVSLCEALAVLLQTWNAAYYRYHVFDNQHFRDIEELLDVNRDILLILRDRTIDSLCSLDEPVVLDVFRRFENLLGPVGAAKCLHLIAPRFFPLWDRAIAKEYVGTLQARGTNCKRYLRFMKIAREQTESLGGERGIGRNPLKAIDEWNYCKFTRQWV